MRIRILCLAVLFALIFSGCMSGRSPETVQRQRFEQLQAVQEMNPDGIRILNMTSVLRPGDTGSITIQGKPETRYLITATFKPRSATINNSVRAFVTKTSDKNGKLTWTWQVSENTEIGTYPVSISGGGAHLRTTYTITR